MKILAQSDRALFYWMFNLMAKRDCGWIKWVSKTGDGQLYVVLGALLWWLEPEHGALFLSSGLLAYTLEIPVYLILKRALKRKRPCDCANNFNAHITPSDKFSLPSGHTAAAFLMASLVSAFYPNLLIFAYFWASCIGLSRVLLGVHYPGDIVAGAALGMSIALISLSIF
ncbi:phosphatase PAP2 family protein [Paraglaciecola aquimarina]|uniref:undecaprenyl-diphosphate phosphatase n=1 Tax=Paraglaciecola aquimarina TaxID=1235557 RepID=A0ABU3ST41_9ALTE|nr:phosphatase PAP2 family protein [Paraglaciecola aquimarina]MDU0353154.1 phosphatase PAP2 family protein [Paraglaciecola aquimarina]